MDKVAKAVLSISFVFYLLALIVLLFLGNRGYIFADLSLIEYIKSSSNFHHHPFKTIITYVKAILDGSMNMDIPLKNLFGNFLMFLPMGIYLPCLIKKTKKVSIFLISMITLLFIIEVIQVITRRGSFDVDDFILNMLGAWIGFRIWKTKVIQKLLE